MVGKTISHYKITEKLGEGGMGEIYLADDTELDRKVALKFLPEHLTHDKENVERFKREAKAAAALNHPNIVTIHDVIESENQVCIIMEYVKGDSLRTKIDSGISDTDEVLDIVKQICEGLSEAHKADIVHRDIKPENILIDSRGRIKILDFGLAKLKGVSKLTKETSTLGTIYYMSPEQLQGKEVDHKSDIWSLGIVIYELLTGEPPFSGDYEQAVSYAILNEKIKPIIDNDTPQELITIIEKCLIKNPADRYQHVDDLIVDLRQLKELSALKTSQTKPEISTTKKKSRLFISSLVVSILVCIAILYFVFFKTAEEVGSFPERKMLVVLPFKNLGSPEDEYFADGITEEITSRLSEIKQLGVIGRTSADRYKNTEKSINQIGEELGVEYLLEGSVRWEKLSGKESRIRVTPQLIKISDGTHIWTKRYDAILESVFDLQSDIAEKVTNALDITLLGAEQKSISKKPTDNIEAYQYYLRGNLYYNQGSAKENYSVAEQMFLKATELDSNFVLAYTRLAQINVDFYWFYWERTKHRLRKSKYYIDKAKEINPDIPEIYLALGQYYYHGFLDYDRALNELETGLKIKPNDGEILSYVGFVKRRQGRFEETITDLKKSLELDPLNESLNFNIGETFILIKNYEMAEKYLDKVISTIPDWDHHMFLKQRFTFFVTEILKAH